MRTLSRLPVSQSVTDSVEVKRTGTSATLAAGGSVPPTIHDLPETAEGPMERVGSGAVGLVFVLETSNAFEAAEPDCCGLDCAAEVCVDGVAGLLPPVRVWPAFEVLPGTLG